jgi:uncharacterized protein YnzC (UPF0291/DUF896 family)
MKSTIAAILVVSLLAMSITCNTQERIQETSHILREFENKNADEIFPVWHLLFKKSYSINSEEGQKRFIIFKNNLEYIRQKNSENKGFTLGLNQFADMINEEYQKLNLSSVQSDEKTSFETQHNSHSELKYMIEDNDERKLLKRELPLPMMTSQRQLSSPFGEHILRNSIQGRFNLDENSEINFDNEAEKVDQEDLRKNILDRFEANNSDSNEEFLNQVRKSILERFDASKISDFNSEALRKEIQERFNPNTNSQVDFDEETLRKEIQERFNPNINSQFEFDEQTLRKDIQERFNPNNPNENSFDLEELRRSIQDRFDPSKITEEENFDEEALRKDITERFNPSQPDEINFDDLRKSIEERFNPKESSDIDLSELRKSIEARFNPSEENNFDLEALKKNIAERFNPAQSDELDLEQLRKSIMDRFDANKIPSEMNNLEDELKKEIANRFNAEPEELNLEDLRKSIMDRFDASKFTEENKFDEQNLRKEIEERFNPTDSKLIMIDASSKDFQFYKSGVLKLTNCKNTNLQMTVVQETQEYLILQSSFDSYWGDSGYMKLSKDSDTRKCFVEK